MLQGDDILALAIKKEDLRKVRMKSRDPFCRNLSLPPGWSRTSTMYIACPLPPYLEGVSDSMEESIKHESVRFCI